MSNENIINADEFDKMTVNKKMNIKFTTQMNCCVKKYKIITKTLIIN